MSIRNTRNAARADDSHYCTLPVKKDPKTQHGGSDLEDPKRNVHIDNRSAVVFGDLAKPCKNAPDATPVDAVIGGNLTVFINGSPAARTGDVTFGGGIGSGGAEQVLHNDTVASLSRYAVDWLVRYLSQLEEIPFAASHDGCYSRAHALRRLLDKQFGVTASKFAVQGNPLLPRIGLVTQNWGWHIAAAVPAVPGAQAPEQFWVIDPSLDPNHAINGSQWFDRAQGVSGKIVHREGPIDGAAYKPKEGGGWEPDNDYSKTDADLKDRRQELINNPALKNAYRRLFDKGPRLELPKPHRP